MELPKHGRRSGSAEYGSENMWTADEERRVKRKIDFQLLPPLTLMYLLCFIDRTNIGNAKIAGMGNDLNLVGSRFNWVLTCLYLAFILVELPSNMILKKLGANIWLPILTFVFGFICLGIAFTKTYAQLVLVRIILGLAEGGMMPGVCFYLSCFYRREELLFRIGIFVASTSMAGAFGGLMATYLGSMSAWGLKGSTLEGWRNIFFFEGLLTMSIALACPFLLPRAPSTCAFLTIRERAIAVERLAKEYECDLYDGITWRDIKRGIFNITNQFCALGFMCTNVAMHSISLFIPTILNQMGYSPYQSQLYSVPPYVVACAVAIAIAFISDRTQRRGIYLVIFGAIAILGYSILRTMESARAKYVGVFIIAIGTFPNGPAFLSWGINNAGLSGVRAVTSAYIMSVGSLGAVTATWTYVEKDQPAFIWGHSVNLGFQVALIILACGCICYCRYENAIRDAGKRDTRLTGLSEIEVRRLGYRHPDFRYMQ